MVDGYADRFDEVDPRKVLEALQTMRTASRLIRELEAYFARHDLSQLRFLTLIVIDREPDRNSLAVSDIADRLDVSRPVVTRTLQTLERAGLIQISQSESDARSRNVSLSDSGKSMLERVLPGYFEILHRPLTDTDG